MPAPKSLRSLYGATDRATVRALTGTGGDRPQEILTPQPIVDALGRLWPEGIGLDPCAAPGSLVLAYEYYYVPRRLTADGKEDYTPQPGDRDGRALPWLDRTYANPIFRDLEEWLGKAQFEARRGLEIAVLAPVRTHRKWYRAARRSATATVWLNADVRFLGFAQSFPAPLSVLYWGTRDIGAAFAGLGDAE